ncbi:hypothetical protein Q2T41_18770 [Maribacter confluentis]|uniref:Uncharacterized protein n=1 Tax=Maribacter confluentis TaxID=1656093 RepID=A0ABT8RUX7_9FLAO|nr:hypothetical protein [Maribacter confluentis]MDO1514702.1 hypothetical protein [Maribacter confluentis]
MKKAIKTQHVFTKNNQVFIKKITSLKKNLKTEWHPISFNWVSIEKVQDCLVLE